MAKEHKVFIKSKTIQFFVAFVIILLFLSAGFFLYRHFFSNKFNRYFIENKYYGFKLQTPKNWIAEGKTVYSEDNIAQILVECKNDKSNNTSAYEIGEFRFEDQRYPQDFGDPGYFPDGLSSGVILGITINCIPDGIKSKIGNSVFSNLEIAGEKTFEEVLNSPEFGRTESLSFLHNNFQYKINEYVYISPVDQKRPNGYPEKLRENYAEVLNKIISSFQFIR